MSEDDFSPGSPGAVFDPAPQFDVSSLDVNSLPIAGLGDKQPAGDPFDYEGILKGGRSAKDKWDLGIGGFGFEEWGDYGLGGGGLSGVNDGDRDWGTSWQLGADEGVSGLLQGAGIGFDSDGFWSWLAKVFGLGTGEVNVSSGPKGVDIVVSDQGGQKSGQLGVGGSDKLGTYIDGDNNIHIVHRTGTGDFDQNTHIKASPATQGLHKANENFVVWKKTPDPEGDMRHTGGPLPSWARSRLNELWLRKPTSDTSEWGSTGLGGTRARLSRSALDLIRSGGVTDPVPYADTTRGGASSVGYVKPRGPASDEGGGGGFGPEG